LEKFLNCDAMLYTILDVAPCSFSLGSTRWLPEFK
jgi:hypothetical protein